MPQNRVSKSVQDSTVKEIRRDLQLAAQDFLQESYKDVEDSSKELHALYKLNVLSQELIKWIVM